MLRSLCPRCSREALRDLASLCFRAGLRERLCARLQRAWACRRGTRCRRAIVGGLDRLRPATDSVWRALYRHAIGSTQLRLVRSSLRSRPGVLDGGVRGGLSCDADGVRRAVRVAEHQQHALWPVWSRVRARGGLRRRCLWPPVRTDPVDVRRRRRCRTLLRGSEQRSRQLRRVRASLRAGIQLPGWRLPARLPLGSDAVRDALRGFYQRSAELRRVRRRVFRRAGLHGLCLRGHLCRWTDRLRRRLRHHRQRSGALRRVCDGLRGRRGLCSWGVHRVMPGG